MFKCFTSYRGALILAAAVVVGAYLALWHGAHVAAGLPFLVILACPLMHIFTHGGHGHSHGHGNKAESPSDPLSRQSPDKGE